MSGTREAEVSICATEAKHAAKNVEGHVETIRAAMRACVDHWMVLDEETQFLGAIGGVLLLADERGDEELRDRITRELAFLRSLSAATRGVPVDMGRAIDDVGNVDDMFGLRKMWDEVKAERANA